MSEAYRELLVQLESSAALPQLQGPALVDEYRRLQPLSARLAPAELGDLVIRVAGRHALLGPPSSPVALAILVAASERPARFDSGQLRQLLALLRADSFLDGSSRAVEGYLGIAVRASHEAATPETCVEADALVAHLGPAISLSALAAISVAVDAAPLPPVTRIAEQPPEIYGVSLRFVLTLPVETQRALAELCSFEDSGVFLYLPHRQQGAAEREAAVNEVLADAPGVLSHCDSVLALAEGRAAALHAGVLPYESDKLFHPTETAEIGRAAILMLTADVPDAGRRVAALIEAAAIAPSTAKTAPSQGLTAALGKAVAESPTPEAISGAREALGRIRHQGVAKRLDRQLKTAIVVLPERGPVALRISAEGKPTAAQLTGFRRALEGQLALDEVWSVQEWKRLLFGTPETARIAAGLVYVLERPDGSGVSFLGGPGAGRTAARDSGGVPMQVAGGDVRLWHPVLAVGAERDRWRERIWAETLVQPFRQVFREFYRSVDGGNPAISEFEGFVVDVKPFLGLASAQGWRLDRNDGIVRRFGASSVIFAVGGTLFPGAEGHTETGRVSIRMGCPATPTAPADLPPALFSEIMRAVDLLVSTTAVEHTNEETHALTRWKSGSFDAIAVRRIVLEHVYAGEPRVLIEGRHARVGTFDVHLATGRVTRHGEPVDTPPPSSKKHRSLVADDEKTLPIVLDRIESLLEHT